MHSFLATGFDTQGLCRREPDFDPESNGITTSWWHLFRMEGGVQKVKLEISKYGTHTLDPKHTQHY